MLKETLFSVLLLLLFLMPAMGVAESSEFEWGICAAIGCGLPRQPYIRPYQDYIPSYTESLSLPKTYTSSYLEVSEGERIGMTVYGRTITDLNVGVEAAAADVEIKIDIYDIMPTFTGFPLKSVPSHPTGNLYKYIEITHVNLANENISNVTITFDVDGRWFLENNVSEDEIVLSRYNGSWEELPTTIRGWITWPDYVDFRYKSFSTGLSWFVIGTKIKLPQVILVANSIDRARSPLETELSDEFDVVFTTPSKFKKYKTSERIIFLGGPDATGVGPIVDELLTEEEEDYLRAELWNNGLYQRKDVWAEGQTVLVVAGNTRKDTRFVQVDNIEAIRWMLSNYRAQPATPSEDRKRPVITIRTPWDNINSTEEQIWLEGTIEDASEIVNSTYRINDGKEKNLYGTDGTFSRQIVLVEGENLISVYAKDSFGNRQTVTVNVTYLSPTVNQGGGGDIPGTSTQSDGRFPGCCGRAGPIPPED